jgi:hypothetical protein
LRLRFGVVAADRPLPAWKVEVLERLLALEGLDLALLLEDPPVRRPPLVTRAFRSWRCRVVPALRPRDADELLMGVPTRALSKSLGDPAEAHAPEGLDFVLDLRDRDETLEPRLPAPTLGARHGVWSFVHDDPFLPRPRARGKADSPTARFRLQAELPERPRPLILAEGHTRVVPWAYGRTLHGMFRIGAAFPAQVCAALQAGAEDLSGRGPDSELEVGGTPRVGQMLFAACRLFVEKLRRAVHFMFRTEEWTLGLIQAPIHRLLDGTGLPEHVVVPPQGGGRFLADPFGISSENGVRVACEVYDYRRRTGWLARLELDVEGRVRSPARPLSLEFPHHASFPYLFQDEGRWFCVPETYQAGTVTLWETEPELVEWRRVATLLDDIALLDPVVVRHENLWWLMGTPHFAGDTMSMLSIWYAEDLAGPWHPHARNPVKVDVRSARCAGTPFSYKGGLYRPGQDSSRSYGSGVVIHRIERLTPTEFAETPVARVDPDPASDFPDGIHTLSAVGDRVLIDLKRFSFIPGAPAADLGHRILARLRALIHG